MHLATITNFMGAAATGALDARFGLPATIGALVDGQFTFAQGPLPPDQGAAQRFEHDADRGASSAFGRLGIDHAVPAPTALADAPGR